MLEFDFGVWILILESGFLNSGSWDLGKVVGGGGGGGGAPTVWLSSASTWGAKSTHSSKRS